MGEPSDVWTDEGGGEGRGIEKNLVEGGADRVT